MELSDLITDIDSKKVLSIAFFGALTGAIAGHINFEEKMSESNRPSFRKLYDKVGKEGIKAIISMAGGIPAINYEKGTTATNFFEGIMYTAEFRLGYEVGYNGYKTIKNYLNKED